MLTVGNSSLPYLEHRCTQYLWIISARVDSSTHMRKYTSQTRKMIFTEVCGNASMYFVRTTDVKCGVHMENSLFCVLLSKA